MKLNYPFENIILDQEKLTLVSRERGLKEVLFDDIERIYISKKKSIFIRFFILLIAVAAVLSFVLFYFSFSWISIPLAISALPFINKMKDSKCYELKIKLKNGHLFRRKVSPDDKNQNILLLNKIKQQIFAYKMR
jgi:Ca2+-dependent lipid-binding protein